MNIVIVGAGGVGGYYGALLARAGHGRLRGILVGTQGSIPLDLSLAGVGASIRSTAVIPRASAE
jgi:hypothetical protein